MLTRGLSFLSWRAHPKYGITATIDFADARFAASTINKSSIRLSELGKVDCIRNTCLPRIDSSYETANSPSAKCSIIILPNGQSRLLQTFSAKYRDLLRSEEHTSELQSRPHLVCRLL